MNLLATKPHAGRVSEFISDRLRANWNEEQCQAVVNEFYVLLVQIVFEEEFAEEYGFSGLSKTLFPLLPDIDLKSCLIWLLRLRAWEACLSTKERSLLGKAIINWV